MDQFDIWKKALLSAFFLLVTSCSQPCQQWQIQETITRCPYYSSGKIFLSPNEEFGTLELEIDRGSSGLKMYVNAFILEIPSLPDDCSKAELIVSIENQSFTVITDRFEGGQRLLVPSEAANIIINALLECKTICLHAGRFQSTIISTGFPQVYYELVE